MNGERPRIRAERRDRVCVVAVSGPLDRTASAGLTACLETERAAHPGRLVIDMSGVSSVDPAGARALAIAARPVPGQCRVIVRSLRPDARQRLEQSGLDLSWLDQGWLDRETAPVGSAPAREGALADSATAVLVNEWRHLHSSVERAIASSRQAAQALACTEDHVAATLARLAVRRPASAARLQTLSQIARDYALHLRGPLEPDATPDPASLPPYTASSTIGRAVAFIGERAREEISVVDIAASAFVTVRAVQLAFRRYLGTTPLAYLRQVRLQNAHDQLLSVDPDHVSVTAVAVGWHFSSSSRFSAYYRAAYGVTPSQSLRQHNPQGPAGVAEATLGIRSA